MKDLKDYININEKKKSFKLNNDQRNALAECIGIALGNLGEDEDISQYKKFIDLLSDNEKKNLDSLYDMIDNDEDYKYISNRNIQKEEIDILVKLYNYCNDNELLDNNWDLIDAFEMICL